MRGLGLLLCAAVLGALVVAPRASADVCDATTNPAADITATMAALHGATTCTPQGATVQTSYLLGTASPPATESNVVGWVADPPADIGGSLSGLTPCTTYFFRLRVLDKDAVEHLGGILSFTTLGCPSETPPIITVDPRDESADVTISKSASASEIDIGSAVTFTLVVGNNGPQTAFDVAAEDALPDIGDEEARAASAFISL